MFKELADHIHQVTGSLLLLTETARRSVDALEHRVATEAHAVSEISYRLERTSRDVARQTAEIPAKLEAATDRVREQLAEDVARQVQTLRAAFIVCTVLMLVAVFAAQWLAATSGTGRGATEPSTAPALADTRGR